MATRKDCLDEIARRTGRPRKEVEDQLGKMLERAELYEKDGLGRTEAIARARNEMLGEIAKRTADARTALAGKAVELRDQHIGESLPKPPSPFGRVWGSIVEPFDVFFRSGAQYAKHGELRGERAANWQRLADLRRSDDEDLVSASREAETVAEPASIDAQKSVSAAGAAAKEAEALVAGMLPRLSKEERALFEERLATIRDDARSTQQVIKEGVECLLVALA